MAKPKYDGVIEAVRYKPEGKVDWVRAYLKRGPTFSDHVLIQRQALIDMLKSGKKFMAGRRVLQKASTFEVTEAVRILEKNGRSILVTGVDNADQDHLADVPQI